MLKGKARNDELLKGAAPNSAYEMSLYGWPNMKEIFAKPFPQMCTEMFR